MKSIAMEVTPVHYTDAGIKILSFTKPEGKRCFRMHWHERVEVIRVKSGVMTVECGAGMFQISSGELALFPPKMPHRGFAQAGTVTYDVVMFDVRSFFNETEICRQLLPAMFDGRAKFRIVTGNAEIIECFDQIVSLMPSEALRGTALVYQILSLIFEKMLLELKADLPLDSTMRQILLYLQEHYAEDLSTAILSERFGYTASHFCRKFKEATWLSPMKYLQILRLEEASRQLAEGEKTVSEVSAICGFSDQNYFTRCFKAHFGVPPTKFKKV